MARSTVDFPCAVGAHDSYDFAFLYAEGRLVQGDDGAIVDGDVHELQQPHFTVAVIRFHQGIILTGLVTQVSFYNLGAVQDVLDLAFG